MHGRLGTVISVATVASVLLIASDCAAQQAAAKPVESQWRSDILDNTEAFRALFKPNAVQHAVQEVPAWEERFKKLQRKSRRDRVVPKLPGGDKRIAQLQEAIQKYPKSPYADDAALLLARAYFLYNDDAEKAIAGLYDVIKEHPDGEWVAEDPIVLDYIANRLLTRGREDVTKLPYSDVMGGYMYRVGSYINYVFAHLNRTSDEAKYCIAWIILRTRKEQRYGEAEDLLRSVIARNGDAGRTQADLKAAKRLENKWLETRLPRTERRAHSLLIDLLRKEGKVVAAEEAAEDYARLHKGHESVQGILWYAQTDGIPAWLIELLEHREAFRALFKPGTTGNTGSEVGQWLRSRSQGGPKGGEERIAQLQEALRKYPNSPYADDAALLLARAYYFYRGDPRKAIAELYEVVKKYPKGAWIAEGGIVRTWIAPLAGNPETMVKEFPSEDTMTYNSGLSSYMTYAFEHPNYTADEAKCWIAFIILLTKNEQRYQEAEKLLRSVIARHTDADSGSIIASRPQADLEAARQLVNAQILSLPRSECHAYTHLIALLKKMGKHAAAEKAAAELKFIENWETKVAARRAINAQRAALRRSMPKPPVSTPDVPPSDKK